MSIITEYNAELAECRRLLTELDEALCRHKAEAGELAGMNWGYIGDLKAVKVQLWEILDFMNNEEN